MTDENYEDLTGYAAIPRWIQRDPRISMHAKMVYLAINSRMGRNAAAFPSVQTMATDCGMSVSSTRRALRELEALGVLVSVSRVGTSNIYRLDASVTLNYPPEGGSVTLTGGSVTLTGGVGHTDRLSIQEKDSTKDSSKKLLSSADASDAVVDSVFNAWPKKQGRKLAGEKWRSALKRFHGTEVELAARAMEFSGEYKRLKYPVDFVPALSVWLNQDRWNDPLPAPRYVKPEKPNKDQQALDVVNMAAAMQASRDQKALSVKHEWAEIEA
jgi:hypothetical protein